MSTAVPGTDVVVREAELQDAAAIARVHVQTWQSAYRGLVPEVVLDGLSIERRTGAWKEWLEPDRASRRNLEGLGRIVAHSNTWIAQREGEIVGFANAGACRDDDAPADSGEVFAIYVAPDVWDRGVGAALMHAALEWLRAQGFTLATLWVLEGNERGRTFYEKGGWRADGRKQELDFAGTELLEMRYRIEL